MTLNLCSPCPSRFSRPPALHLPRFLDAVLTSHSAASLTLRGYVALSAASSSFPHRASLSESKNGSIADESVPGVLTDKLLSEVSGAKDADEALSIISERSGRSGGVISVPDCCLIIAAALDRSNAELALSVFYAMRSSFGQGVSEDGPLVERWRWSRPDVSVYTLLIQGLAASLRVSDALSMIHGICQVGVSPGEEVPFGKVVRCPACTIAVAVAQPQDGVQIVSCAKCRYKYELFSGDIINTESEEVRQRTLVASSLHFF